MIDIDEISEAWRTNHRINLRILEEVSDAGLRSTLSRRGGRDVAGELAHLQYVRVYQLKGRARALAAGARVFETGEEPAREELREALEDSARRIEEWLRRAAGGEPGVRAFKKGLVPTLAYLISHEAHHRGRILLTLKVAGHPLASKTRYAIWDWDRL